MAVPDHEFSNPDTASLWEATDSLQQLIKARKSNGPRNTSAESKLRQRIDDVLKKKPLTELLESVPMNHQGAYTPLHPQKWAIVVRSLRTYSALSEPSLLSRSRRVWQTIEKYWAHAWAWVDYLHHRPNVDSVRLIIHLFISLSENVEHRRAEIVDLLHAEPNCVVLLIDIWFRIPEYMFQIRGNLALVPLAKAMAAVYCESDSVEIRAIVERELSRRVQGSGHRLFRHVARLLRILLTLSDKEEDGGVLASLELSSQLLVDRTRSLHPSVLPRDMINVCVALVRRHAGQPYEVVAQAACFFLEQAWTLTADLRPIIWALQEGLLPNILCMKQPKLRKGDPMVLLKQLQPALSHRRVLRTFWHVYQRDKLSIEKAPWHPKILDDLIERAEKHWAIFEKLQKEWDATTTHCHNPDCPLPALDLYQCPCKTAYYCSRECQRKNWKDDHRTKCHFFRWDLIEETKVPLPHPLYNSRDIDFLTQINKAFMDDHLNEVFEEAKKIDPTLMKTFNLTVGWGRGEPKYWVGVARYFIQPKMVIMQTGLIMGSEFTLVTLPGATLELNDTDDEEEGEGNKEDGDERDADENDEDETKDSDGDEDTETQSDESAELEAID